MMQAFTETTIPRRGGVALLVCIFVMALTTLIVVSMFEDQMLQTTAVRHTREYESALYLAGAAVHDALAEMEASEEAFAPFSVGPIEFPAGSGNTYQAEAVAAGGDVLITGWGTAGGFTRYLQVTVTRQGP